MIIDVIIDRKNGRPYNSYDVLKYIYDEAMLFKFDDIIDALDYGNEIDIKRALCNYIDTQGYDPAIKDYINYVNWRYNFIEPRV